MAARRPPTALAGAHVDMRVGKVGSVFAQLSAGTIRVLAVMDQERSKFVPNAPTMAEEGYPDFSWYNATGISAPKGTPQEIVDVLVKAIKVTVENDEARKKLEDVGLIGRFMGPDEFAAYWKDYEKKIEPLVKEVKSQQ